MRRNFNPVTAIFFVIWCLGLGVSASADVYVCAVKTSRSYGWINTNYYFDFNPEKTLVRVYQFRSKSIAHTKLGPPDARKRNVAVKKLRGEKYRMAFQRRGRSTNGGTHSVRYSMDLDFQKSKLTVRAVLLGYRLSDMGHCIPSSAGNEDRDLNNLKSSLRARSK